MVFYKDMKINILTSSYIFSSVPVLCPIMSPSISETLIAVDRSICEQWCVKLNADGSTGMENQVEGYGMWWMEEGDAKDM